MFAERYFFHLPIYQLYLFTLHGFAEKSFQCFFMLDVNAINVEDMSVKVKVLPAPMAHRAAPISVSIALGHSSANAVRIPTAGGWSTGSSACLTSPLLSHLSSARREGSEYHF